MGVGAEMKPRLRKMGNLWYCFTMSMTSWLGIGETAKKAYEDWAGR